MGAGYVRVNMYVLHKDTLTDETCHTVCLKKYLPVLRHSSLSLLLFDSSDCALGRSEEYATHDCARWCS